MSMTAHLFILLGLWPAGLSLADGATPAIERVSGSTVEWTRLMTGDKYWNRHTAGDSRLLTLMRENTSLNIAREWHEVRADNLSALCGYPFVYAADIAGLPEAEGKNLAEYLKRGGFLFIDACINQDINPDPQVFFQRQVALLTKYLPELQVADVDPKHDVFSIYFRFEGGPPMTRAASSWSMKETFPLRSLTVGKRVVGMISLSGLQCAWAGVGMASGRPRQPMEAMKMATNIYIYAMTR